jgi:hypothetical protein
LIKITKEKPVIKITENNWVITMPYSWVHAGELCVSYYRFHKKPFRIWWSIHDIDIVGENVIFETSVETVSQTINSLLLLKYSNMGIPQEVIDFLAKFCNKIGMENAIKQIGKNTDLILTLDQMKILGIEDERGRITGRKFGI